MGRYFLKHMSARLQCPARGIPRQPTPPAAVPLRNQQRAPAPAKTHDSDFHHSSLNFPF